MPLTPTPAASTARAVRVATSSLAFQSTVRTSSLGVGKARARERVGGDGRPKGRIWRQLAERDGPSRVARRRGGARGRALRRATRRSCYTVVVTAATRLDTTASRGLQGPRRGPPAPAVARPPPSPDEALRDRPHRRLRSAGDRAREPADPRPRPAAHGAPRGRHHARGPPRGG